MVIWFLVFQSVIRVSDRNIESKLRFRTYFVVVCC